MKTKTINIYKFDELNEDIQEKVLNSFRENNDYNFLEDSLNEYLKTLLEEEKIKVLGDLSLRYSLGYSQGDGVSFIGSFEYKGYDFKINPNVLSNHYSHSRTTDIYGYDDTLSDDDSDDLTEELNLIKKAEADEVLNEFEQIYFKICDKIEKEGYKEIDDENSDEAIKEKIDELYFNENGGIE